MNPRVLITLLASLSMLAALSIDTYLPALPSIAQEFTVSAAAAQQLLSVFLGAYAFMTLFYGTLSDSFGRRPVIVISLVIYLGGSIGCALAPNFGWLLFFRFVQGLSGGAGNVVGRAMIGDLFAGAEAQRTMAFVSMLFGIAPAIAPILGGWLQSTLGWRSIFWFISIFTFVLWGLSQQFLPESLGPERRHPFHFKVILANYWQVGGHVRFVLLALGNALTFSGVSIYIGSAPAFAYDILHLTSREFGWLFVPLIGGMTLGSMLAARLSRELAPSVIIRGGYGLMLASALGNVVYNYFQAAAIPWAVLPLFVYGLGMAFAASAMSMRMLDMFPKTRGLVSSLMSFVFMTVFSLVSGLLCPRIYDSALHLALGVLAGVVLSMIFWRLGGPTPAHEVPMPRVETPEEIPIDV